MLKNQSESTETHSLLPVDKQKEEHNNVLKEVKNVSNAFIVSSCIGAISDSMIFILSVAFAYTLPGSSSNMITLMVFLQSLAQIIGISLSAYLSDIIGFDKSSIITSTILLISQIIQSTSFNITQFIIGNTLLGFAKNDIEIFSIGWIGKLLPYNTAQYYTAYFYSLITVFMLIGLCTGGLLSTYINYRIIYIVSTIIIFFRWIYILIKIRNKQKNLIKKQLKFISYYLSLKQQHINNDNDDEKVIDKKFDENDCFPLCLEEIYKDKPFDNNELEIRERGIIYWTEMIFNIIQFSAATCNYDIAGPFFIVYMMETWNLSPLTSVTQIISNALAFTVISFIAPKLFENMSILKMYFISLPLQICVLIILIFLLPSVKKSDIYLFWIYGVLGATLFGLIFLIVELIILKLQPKRHTGKISGIKTVLRYIIVAIFATLIAYTWNIGNKHFWFWYIQGSVFILSIISTVLAIFTRIFFINNKK